jgi:hypothetical protein
VVANCRSNHSSNCGRSGGSVFNFYSFLGLLKIYPVEEVISKDTSGSTCGRGQCGGDSSATPGAWHDGTIILLLFFSYGFTVSYCFTSLDVFLSKLFPTFIFITNLSVEFFFSVKKRYKSLHKKCEKNLNSY